MEYSLIRSSRRSLAIEIGDMGMIVIRAPYELPMSEIDAFLKKNENKILVYSQKLREKGVKRYSAKDEIGKELKKKALEVIPERVKYYSDLMNVKYSSLKITSAKKHYGSCSNKGALCFSLNLMQYESDAVDYVVVHELAHIVHLDHSRDFWLTVEKYMPDYKRRRAMLK